MARFASVQHEEEEGEAEEHEEGEGEREGEGPEETAPGAEQPQEDPLIKVYVRGEEKAVQAASAAIQRIVEGEVGAQQGGAAWVHLLLV